ncbi:unnamed protein product [Penicillium salamii]|uniref:Uncharacterized protein n=1 Tax=Penicillium salamii TaxID=1612424 RepID=A0A9W4I8L3_9EURO|nr:unnamed protein product [Penicillium salamii]
MMQICDCVYSRFILLVPHVPIQESTMNHHFDSFGLYNVATYSKSPNISM